jgi:hypothetical protein
MSDRTQDQIAMLDAASNHPYECKCKLCKEWWAACGPEMEDDDTPAGYGPFGESLEDEE